MLASLIACVGLWVGSARQAHAATVSLEIEGLDEALLELAVRESLTLAQYVGRDVSAPQLRRLVLRADAEIRRALEPFGYYEPHIERHLREEPQRFHARFEIELGEPVIVRRVHVAVEGPGAEAPAVRAALAQFAPREGERLVHSVYEQSKAAISAALRAQGYLEAEPLERSVRVVAEDRSAEIDLIVRSGERHRFGEVRFSETQFGDEFLERHVPWEEDAYYSSDALLALQRRLVAADYFSAVSVQPDLERMRDGRVPVDVLLVPNERSVYSVGVFVSTDVGPGGRLGLQRRWLNRRGHKLRGEASYASNRRELSLGYRIPNPVIEERELSFGGAYIDEETNTSRSKTTRLAAVQTQQQWFGFTRSLGLQFIRGDFEIDDVPGSSSLLYLEAALSRIREDDASFPRRGYSLGVDVRATPGAWLSDTAFAQIGAKARWVRALGDRSRILLRGDVGAMTVADFDELPPELRFFAGGDRSIRGFDYEEIGETDDAGSVIGGEYLATAGVEFEHYLLERWGVAAFVDAGDAFRDDFDANVGAGFGLRWKSPIGVVRLDIAKPIVTDFDDGWRVHLVIGPDL